MESLKVLQNLRAWINTKFWALPALGVGLSILFALIASCGLSTGPPRPEGVGDHTALDTHIPRGFVLVPLEVQNFESLDSVLGKYGVVDIYPGAVEPGHPKNPIAVGVKILRAPNNPNHFAVLVPEDEAPHLLSQPGPFTVVIENPGKDGMFFERKIRNPPKKARTIIYEGD